MSSKTGGPAFPHLRRHVAPDTYEVISENGMTLRDYFAAKAMQALIAASNFDLSMQVIAGYAYEQADAMMQAKGEQG